MRPTSSRSWACPGAPSWRLLPPAGRQGALRNRVARCPDAARPAPRPPVLVGREAEMARIDAVLGGAASKGPYPGGVGGVGVILIEGESGIGKTSLLEEALARARGLGFQCCSGAAAELERHRPFGAIAQALGMPRRWEGEGTPADDAGSPETEFRIIDGLVDEVARRATRGPVAIGLDDLQWADPSTLLTLLTLIRMGRQAAELPLVVIGTLRPLPRSIEMETVLAALRAGSGGVLRLTLGRLEAGAVAALASNLLGAEPGPGLLRQLARASGNPFFATELTASLAREGAIAFAQEGDLVRAEVTGPEGEAVPMPASLTATILHRMEYLGPETLETLQVASILGSRFSVADLAIAVGQPAASLTALVTATARAGVIGEAGAELAFRHDLIREALYDSMSPTLRSWWHLAAASLLEGTGRSRADVAEHVVRGAVPGDPAAAEWLRVAARQAAAQSPSVAAQLLTRALEVAPAGDPHRAAARSDLAVYALWCERPADAEAICRALLAEDESCPLDPDLRARARACLIEATVRQGRVDEARREIEAALQAPGLDGLRPAHLLVWQATCQAAGWDLAGAAASGGRALVLAERGGDETAAGAALATLAVVHHLRGDFAEALRQGREALERVARGAGALRQPVQPVLNLAGFFVDVDRAAEARETLGAWRRFRRHEASGWSYALERALLGEAAFWMGEWDAACTDLEAALHVARTVGTRPGMLLAPTLLALIALHRDDLATARRELAAAEDGGDCSGLQWRPDRPLWARGLLAEAEGRPAEALASLRGAWNLCCAAGAATEYPVFGPDLVRLAVQQREMALAQEVTAAVEALAAGAGVAFMNGAAARCRALVSGAPSAHRAAVAAYRGSSRRRELGLACEDAAACLAAAGRPGEAGPLAEEAREIFRSIGARRDLARAVARVDAWFHADGPALAEAAPPSVPGWETLTPSEAAVARHMAAGRTNPEIARLQEVSVRTVQTHASRVLAKLGVPRRAGLARLLSGAGSTEPGRDAGGSERGRR
ncbi:MAG TPA: AAA family ATPase [Actinomycetota bacterium]|nr:AAA family ATPase [Actinomycetota bacterium]